MENYMVRKLMKQHDMHKSPFSPGITSRKTFTNPPVKQISLKDEFLKQYLAQSGGTKLDKNFTLSWVNKQQESRRRQQFISDDAGEERSGLVWADKSPRSLLPTISSPSNKATTPSNRLATEPAVYESERGQDNSVVKKYFVKKYQGKSSRGSHGLSTQQDSNFSLEGTDVSRQMTTPTQACEEHDSLQIGGLSSKYSVLKTMEEMYSGDFKNNHEKGGKSNLLKKSPYGRNYESIPKFKLKELVKITKNMVDDEVLMDRFENPYENNLSFKMPINASVRNQSNLKLKELEVKTQVLKNIREVEESMIKEVTLLLESPKNLKPLVNAHSKPGDGKDNCEGKSQKRRNLMMYTMMNRKK